MANNKHEVKKTKLLKQQRDLGKITDKFNKEQQKLDVRRQRHQSKVDKNMSDLKEVELMLNPSQPSQSAAGTVPLAAPDTTSKATERE